MIVGRGDVVAETVLPCRWAVLRFGPVDAGVAKTAVLLLGYPSELN